MGAVALPAGGRLHLDTSALIYAVEKNPVFWPVLQPVWLAAKAGTIHLETSSLSLLEVLVGPLKSGNNALAATYDNLLHSSDLLVYSIDDAVLREAARLRSVVPGLRTPDAIHAATALLNLPFTYLTNDAGFRKVPGLPVTVLSDLLTP